MEECTIVAEGHRARDVMTARDRVRRAPSACRGEPRTALRTEFAFVLPRGLRRRRRDRPPRGLMRLATARDEILPLRDPRVRENEAYLTVLLLAA